MTDVTPTETKIETKLKFMYERTWKKLSKDQRQKMGIYLRKNCYPSQNNELPDMDGLIFWLTNENDQVVSTLLLKDNSIWNVCTGQDFRRRGYAEFLLLKLQAWWKKRYSFSKKPLVLYVYKVNSSAIDLYKKIGFVINDKYVKEPDTYQMVWSV